MVTGIIGGVLGLFCLSYAIFARSHSWFQSLTHWLCAGLGLLLLSRFWRHTAFYLGLQGVAAYVCEHPKTAGKEWTRHSKWLLNTLFTVQIHNETTYTQPVIFVMNHIAHSRPFDEFCLALIEQPNLKIVALPRKPDSYPDIIMKSLEYVPVKHGSGYEGFMQQCTKTLHDGHSLLLFPEGKRTDKQLHWTQLAEFQSGTFELALQNRIPIVPIILEGFNCPDGWIKGFGQGAQPLRLHYLDPIDTVECVERGKTANDLKHLVRYQMNQKLKRILLKSLPQEKAQVLQKYI